MIFYRFFYSIKTMSHDKMQEYVNVDYEREVSIVGFGGKKGDGRIIAEARLIQEESSNFGEVAFLIDTPYQGMGGGLLSPGIAHRRGPETGACRTDRPGARRESSHDQGV